MPRYTGSLHDYGKGRHVTDTDTHETNDDNTDPPAQPCAVCGVAGAVVELPDGTLYCHAHKGPAVASADTAAPPAVEPSVVDRGTTADPAPLTESPNTADGDTEDVWVYDKAVRLVASLTLEAALRCLNEDGTFGDPAVGWAPEGDGTLFITEAGAQLAVAMLIDAADLGRDTIQTLADLLADRQTPTEGNEVD